MSLLGVLPRSRSRRSARTPGYVEIKMRAPKPFDDCFPPSTTQRSIKLEDQGAVHFRLHTPDHASIRYMFKSVDTESQMPTAHWNHDEALAAKIPNQGPVPEWTGPAILCIGHAKFHAKIEGYERLALLHLQTAPGAPAQIHDVQIAKDGHVDVVVKCRAMEAPEDTLKRMIESRKAALAMFKSAVPPKFYRVLAADPMMHSAIYDGLRLAQGDIMKPAWWGFGQNAAHSELSATLMFFESLFSLRDSGIDLENTKTETLLSIALSAHAGQWSKEYYDDRELTLTLGEDCDDMVLRMISIANAFRHHSEALKAALNKKFKSNDPLHALGTKLLESVKTHRILFCQGIASPPHPGVERGEKIGHVYGLLVQDNGPTDYPGDTDELEWEKPPKMAWEDVSTNPEITAELCETTMGNLKELWQAAIMEATAASEAFPRKSEETPPVNPHVAQIRDTQGDESYQSLNMIIQHNAAIYLFRENKKGSIEPGVNPLHLLKTHKFETGDPEQDRKVYLLRMKTDPKYRHGTDRVHGRVEADIAEQAAVFKHFRDAVLPSVSKPGAGAGGGAPAPEPPLPEAGPSGASFVTSAMGATKFNMRPTYCTAAGFKTFCPM